MVRNPTEPKRKIESSSVFQAPHPSLAFLPCRFAPLFFHCPPGVWEFLESKDAVSIVGENLHRGSTKACQALIEAAADKWHEEEGEYRDDITAIVVQLQHLWNNEKAKT